MSCSESAMGESGRVDVMNIKKEEEKTSKLHRNKKEEEENKKVL